MVDHATSTTASPREERRRIRVEMTRSQILDAAEHAFAAAGFHHTTIKSIAEQCEIAVGTFYILFEDKESLYEAVLRRRGDELKALMDAKAGAPRSEATTLVELAELQIGFFRRYPDWTTVASALVSGSRAAAAGEPVRLYEPGHRVVAGAIAAVIAQGQRDGHVRSGNPAALALIYLGMLETFHRVDSADTTPGSEYSLAEFLDLVSVTFGPTAPGQRRRK